MDTSALRESRDYRVLVLGGLACVVGLAPVVAAYPAFWRYDEGDAAAAATASP